MLVRTTSGKLINIMCNESGLLWGATGPGWFRIGDLDQPGNVAYSATTGDGVRMGVQ